MMRFDGAHMRGSARMRVCLRMWRAVYNETTTKEAPLPGLIPGSGASFVERLFSRPV